MSEEQRPTGRELFDFLNEVGIIHQLAMTLFARVLPAGVHVSHFFILNHMVRLGDGRTPQRLATAMQVTKATMTHSLSVLHERGFISIEHNAQDGRSKLVRLTDEGRRFREAAIANLDVATAGVAEQLDAAALAGTLPVLRHLRTVLDRARDDAGSAESRSVTTAAGKLRVSAGEPPS